MRARRASGSGSRRAAGQPGWKRITEKRHADTMKPPSRAASIAYSGQCRRQSAGPRSAACGMRTAGAARAHRRRRREHLEIEPERLAHRPGLKRAPARRVWWLRVGNLGEMSEAGLPEVPEHGLQEAPPGLSPGGGTVSTHSHPRLDERAEQPGPHRALV